MHTPQKVSFSPDHKISFHLPLIHSIISISLEKSMKNPKTKIVTVFTPERCGRRSVYLQNVL